MNAGKSAMGNSPHVSSAHAIASPDQASGPEVNAQNGMAVQVFNQEALLSRVDGDWQTVVAVISEYLKDTPTRLAALPVVLQNRDAVGLKRLAHSLRGAAATVGADVIRDQATALEAADFDAQANLFFEIAAALPRLFGEFRVQAIAAIAAASCRPVEPYALKILIVEDNPTDARLLEMLLRPAARCDIADNGAQAIRSITASQDHNRSFDLVCLDIQLPMGDGQSVLKAIRDDEATRQVPFAERTKIVMTTALEDPGNILRAFREQCDGYLVKPVDRKRLTALLIDLQLITPPAPPRAPRTRPSPSGLLRIPL